LGSVKNGSAKIDVINKTSEVDFPLSLYRDSSLSDCGWQSIFNQLLIKKSPWHVLYLM